MVEPPIKGFWSWNNQWVLELDGTLIVDGQSVNQTLGYDEIFSWYKINGKPFYFFKKDNSVYLSYDGSTLPIQYDEVIHYQCCEPAMFNPGENSNMVWFYALRAGSWYYVELGMYQ